jgi:hypothetical protein
VQAVVPPAHHHPPHFIEKKYWLFPSNWEDLPLSRQVTNLMGHFAKKLRVFLPWWLVNPILHGKNGRAKILLIGKEVIFFG